MKILCRIGLHDWRGVGHLPGVDPPWLEQCRRCGIGCADSMAGIVWYSYAEMKDVMGTTKFVRPKKCGQCMFGGYDRCCCDPEYTDLHQVKQPRRMTTPTPEARE